MSRTRCAMSLLVLLALAAPRVADAQGMSGDVVVQGTRDRPSRWREAETSHVVLVGDGNERELARLARNVERLHFLLAGLTGRTGRTDDTVKLRVTLIGDVAEFQAMDLRNLRWQQGPFNDLFTLSRYYDPRDTGAVMASTRVDQLIPIVRSPATAERVLGALQSLPATGGEAPATGSGASLNGGANAAGLQGALIGTLGTEGLRGPNEPVTPASVGAESIAVSAESLLYAGYAQHFLLTYFPAAYPRWYLDGFGQIFASLVVRGDDVLEFGRSPRGAGTVLGLFGGFPVAAVLDDSYLAQSPGRTHWTPVHAWLLTHYLFFSDTRRPQLRRYLALRANGADAASAAAVFGDPAQLARDLKTYFHARKPFEQVTYPADKGEEPVIRRLSEGDAAFVKGRLELGARIVVPPPPETGLDAALADRLGKTRGAAVRARDAWLARLHRDADRYPQDAGAQLLLAEAECRSDHPQPCLAAATRAAALAPRDARPVALQGLAMAQAAVAGPRDAQEAALVAARLRIAAANHLDTEAIEPLLAYHASYALADAPAPLSAIDGLQKAMEAVPAAPATRIPLGSALAGLGRLDAARQVVLPVADGAYDSPERPAARALLARIGEAPAAAPPAVPQP